MSRKHSYLALSAALLIGFAIGLICLILRIPVRTAYSDGQFTGFSQQWESKPLKSAIPSFLKSNNIGDHVQLQYSSVLNFLENSNRSEIFGSFLLKGIFMNGSAPELGSAAIEDLSTTKSCIYYLNEMLPDHSKLVDIKDDHVTVQKGSIRKKIYFVNRDAAGSKKYIPTSENTFHGYKKINDNEYGLKPYQMFKGNAKSVLDFTVNIYDTKGKMEGIRISDIEHNALARDLGLKENDVLLAINNESITSVSKCVRAFINIECSDELFIKILRRDNEIGVTFHLYWEGESSWTPMDVLHSKTVSSLFTTSFAAHLF